MKFKKLAEQLQKVEETSSRNEMTEVLAELLNEASVQEVDKICYLSLGRLAPAFEGVEFNLAEKMLVKIIAQAYGVEEANVSNSYKELGDLGEVAEKLRKREQENKRATLSVSDVYEKLLEVAQEAGSGSQERKVGKFASLLKGLDPLSVRYVVRIPLGKLRLGFSDVTLLDALSWMERGDKSLREDLEDAYNISADIGKIAQIFKKSGLRGISHIQAAVGTPIRTALADRLPTMEKIVERMETFAVEPKYDGLRVQVHLDKTRKNNPLRKASGDKGEQAMFEGLDGGDKVAEGPFVRIFSRNLENITHMFPDLVPQIQQINAEQAIFDGEAIAYNAETDEFLPFQETVQRKRKHGIAEKAQEIPLKVFLFDLLYYDGETLLREAFEKRRHLLEQVLRDISGDIVATEQAVVDDEEKLKDYFETYVSEGLEGVVAKKQDSQYQAGSRNLNWVKFKRIESGELLDTLDCVVLGYYRGKGKRTSFGIGAFLVGVLSRDKGKARSGDQYMTIARVGTGVTDAQWKDLKEQFDVLKVEEKPEQYVVEKNVVPDFWVSPQMVVEIKADEITRSPMHTAGKDGQDTGYALRFPRLIKVRKDKSVDECTAVAEVEKLYKFQYEKHDNKKS